MSTDDILMCSGDEPHLHFILSNQCTRKRTVLNNDGDDNIIIIIIIIVIIIIIIALKFEIVYSLLTAPQTVSNT